METLGERIKQARTARGLSRQELSRLCGVSYPTLSGIENGDQESSTQLHRIAAALHVRVEWLATGVGPKNSPDDPDGSAWADVLASTQQVSLGSGAEAEEYAETHKLKFRADSLQRKGLHASNLRVYFAKGDSMFPRIRTGDAILFDATETRPVDGEIFIVQWKGELFAKRAEILDGIVYFRSDNPSGDHVWNKAKRMDSARDPIEIIGRVRWIGSWEGYRN